MNINKKGLSVIIGYILLVVFAIVISAIVFQWLKTYVPAQSLECPEGVSLLINDAVFDANTKTLNLTITNNGRFNVSGYFINIKNDSDQELPTINISNYLKVNEGNARKYASSVLFSPYFQFENFFNPENKTTHFFEIPEKTGNPLMIKIIPVRFQEYNEKQRIVTCGDATSTIEVFILEFLGEDEDENDLNRRVEE